MNFCNDLAMQVLLKQISEGPENKNVVTSPWSLNLLLNMVAAGSRGRTLEQLLDALEAKSTDELNLKSSQMMAMAVPDDNGKRKGGGPVLSTVNGVWADVRFPLKPSYEEVARKYYKADSRTVDFFNKAAEIVKEVNLWAENGTKGLIKNLLSSVPDDTMIILANALYFKGAWENAFKTSMTRDDDFHLLNGETIKVPFMTSKTIEKHFYGSFDGFKLLKLPYRCGDHQDEETFKDAYTTGRQNRQHFNNSFKASKTNKHNYYNPYLASKPNQQRVFNPYIASKTYEQQYYNPYLARNMNEQHYYNTYMASKTGRHTYYNPYMASKMKEQQYYNPYIASESYEHHYYNNPYMASKTNGQNYYNPDMASKIYDQQRCASFDGHKHRKLPYQYDHGDLDGETIKSPFTDSKQNLCSSFDGIMGRKLPHGRYGDDHDEAKQKFSMYVILPDESNGLENLLKKFNSEPLLLHQQCDKVQKVELYKMWLPKFKFSYEFYPSDTMKEMGVDLLFKPLGELTEMVDSDLDSDQVYISKILQKACIEVNEEGTEAAAVTIAIGGYGCSMYTQPLPSFVADHPFFFMIKEEVSGDVFFTGTVLNPLA